MGKRFSGGLANLEGQGRQAGIVWIENTNASLYLWWVCSPSAFVYVWLSQSLSHSPACSLANFLPPTLPLPESLYITRFHMDGQYFQNNRGHEKDA